MTELDIHQDIKDKLKTFIVEKKNTPYNILWIFRLWQEIYIALLYYQYL